MPPRVSRMGKFQNLVDSPASMEGFRAKYRIPQGVGLEYCSLDQILTKRETGQVVIPPSMKVIIGMTTCPVSLLVRIWSKEQYSRPTPCGIQYLALKPSMPVEESTRF